MTESELKQLTSSKRVKNSYIFYGPEQYAMRKNIEQIKNLCIDKQDLFNFNEFRDNSDIQQVYDSAVSLPFMADKRVVLWIDCPLNKLSERETSELCELISTLPETTVMIMSFEAIEIDLKKMPSALKKIIKAAEEHNGASVCFNKRGNAEITRMLCDGAARRGSTLQPSVASYMLETCGDDLSTLVNELSKLCAFSSGQPITKQMVDAVCTKSVDVSIYDLSKKLFLLDMKGVYDIINDLFYLKTPALYILSVLSGVFVDAYRAKVIKGAGQSPEKYAADFGYSEKLSFKMTIASKDASKLSKVAMENCLEALKRCDETLKSSRSNEQTVIEALVTELALWISKSR